MPWRRRRRTWCCCRGTLWTMSCRRTTPGRCWKALAEKWPCCYVTGNHEWWSGEAERICQDIEALGIHVLRGECVDIAVKGQTLTVYGIDDPDSGEDQLPALSPAAEEGYTILLAHRPERIGAYRQYPFDLVVSGHAHGGQWRIPGLLNGSTLPTRGCFLSMPAAAMMRTVWPLW